MKNIIVILGLLITTPILGQGVKLSDSISTVSLVSPNRDTLYLVDQEIGYRIYSSWFTVPKNERPIFIFKNEKWIIEEKLKRN